MPIIIGAADKLKFALKALPRSAATGVMTIKDKVFDKTGKQFYATPAYLYRNQMASALKRYCTTTTYSAFRSHMNLFDPDPGKRAGQIKQGLKPDADCNIVSSQAWAMDLGPDGRVDAMLKEAFDALRVALTVTFIRHHDLVRLKRIEYSRTYDPRSHIIWIDANSATGTVSQF